MSLAYPLVLAFSQDQLAAPVEERINAVHSALLYLQRQPAAGNPPLLNVQLGLFLTSSFYQAADAKRSDFHGGREAQVAISKTGLQEFEYIVGGEIAKLELDEEQQAVIEDLGFEVRGRALEPVAFV